MNNRTKDGRPLSSEAAMIGGTGAIVIGAALIAAVVTTITATESPDVIVLLVAMAGLTGFGIGTVLLVVSSVIWRLDRIERNGETMSVIDDDDVVPIKRRL